MHLIIDTNVFCQDFHRKGESFTALVQGLRRTDIRMRMPRVIFDEILNKYREECVSRYAEYRKAARKLTGFTGRGVDVKDLDGKEIEDVATYEETLKRWCRQSSVRILAYPADNHAEIVKRALERRKPFKPDGAGYRDALIWLTILRMLRSGSDGVYFVSNNTRDFANPDGNGLHEHLIDDLAAIHKPSQAVRLFTNLAQFNGEVIAPNLQVLDELRVNLANNAPFFEECINWLQGTIPAYVEHNQEAARDLLHISDPSASLRVTKVGRISAPELREVRQLSHREALILVRTDAALTFEITMPTADIVEMYRTDSLFTADLVDRVEKPAVVPATPLVNAAFAYDYRTHEINSVSLELEFWKDPADS